MNINNIEKPSLAIFAALIILFLPSISFALTDGSTEAKLVLKLVNSASSDTLDVEVGLDKRAANNIIDYRNGPDQIQGSADDQIFDSIAELDAISYVGPSALEKLRLYAIANIDNNINVAYVVESAHPYQNNLNKVFTIRNINASSMQLHFSQIDIPNGDQLIVRDTRGTEIIRYTNTGNLFDVTSPTISGNTVTLEFISDAFLNRFGFKVDSYQYEPLVVSRPTLVHQEAFPYEYFNYYSEQRIVFSENELYMADWTPLNSSVKRADLGHWRFTEHGFEHVSTRPYNIGAYTLGLLDATPVTATREILDTVSGQTTPLQWIPLYTADAIQLESDGRGFLYVGAQAKYIASNNVDVVVQIFDTQTFSGNWEPTLSSGNELRLHSHRFSAYKRRFYVDAKHLVMNDGQNYSIYDVSDPYNPAHINSISVGPDSQNNWVKPTVMNEHLIIAFRDPDSGANNRISSYELATGYEVGYLPVSEAVMRGMAKTNDANILYAAGQSTIYVVDATTPWNMQLKDSINVFVPDGPGSYIEHVHKVGNKLYVVYKYGDYYNNGLRLRTFVLPDNYPQ